MGENGRWNSRLRFTLAAAMASGMLILGVSQVGASASGAETTCTSTGFMKDNTNLTAAVINPTAAVTGTIDATGCDIGVYFDGAGGGGSVSGATVSGAKYFGILDNGASVDVTGATVTNTGDSPFDGAQHGVAIYYTGGASGTISGNTISLYQKGGVTVDGVGTSATVTGNSVTGLGMVNFIAQNGVQFGYGATGSATGNAISRNGYTGGTWVSVGLLLFDVNASQVRTSRNLLVGNQTNLDLIESNSCASMYGGFYGQLGFCPAPTN